MFYLYQIVGLLAMLALLLVVAHNDGTLIQAGLLH